MIIRIARPFDVGKEFTKEDDRGPELENLPEELGWSSFF